MKVMTIVTCLLAPATVIGGIFGMNFDIIPYSHHEWGFYFAVSIMLIVPLIMFIFSGEEGGFNPQPLKGLYSHLKEMILYSNKAFS